MVLGKATSFMRAYSWLKLLTFWAVLRGDDNSWGDAESISIDSIHGLRGKNLRAKTTGPNNRSNAREAVVIASAFFLSPECFPRVEGRHECGA